MRRVGLVLHIVPHAVVQHRAARAIQSAAQQTQYHPNPDLHRLVSGPDPADRISGKPWAIPVIIIL